MDNTDSVWHDVLVVTKGDIDVLLQEERNSTGVTSFLH